MKLSLDIRASLSQTLTPQQIQYLKLLQLPLIQMEQHIMQEIEQNPLLEIASAEPEENEEIQGPGEIAVFREPEIFEPHQEDYEYSDSPDSTLEFETDYSKSQDDPFEFYQLAWQDDNDGEGGPKSGESEDDDFEPFQMKGEISFVEELIAQIKLLDLSEEEMILAEQIIGNIDMDGYLRRDLSEILDEANNLIYEINIQRLKDKSKKSNNGSSSQIDNPARRFALSQDSLDVLKRFEMYNSATGGYEEFVKVNNLLNKMEYQVAETILKIIQNLDPPGIGSRTIKECLISQVKNIQDPNPAQLLALDILEQSYESFAKKHYAHITKLLDVTEENLKEAIDFIRKLNPKPGGGDLQTGINSVIPDFIIEKDEETDELLITVNDSRLPTLKLNVAYEKLRKESRQRSFNKETKEWIKGKYDDAKFLLKAIRQRKSTLLKVMTAIAQLQKEFFYNGPVALRPLIYKNISDETSLDIATICRIVNGKYVQTEYGTYELKFFFSESLQNDEGDDVSTTVIKQIIKDIILEEEKDKPFSDDKISEELKKKGYNVARRTVAKYREQLKIPVARLRREL
ncbi:MAG: RNA polymerase factor sigma-54 [Candidatus Kapabacteria bacterium]|nr:RNA polymerase factor sigma-54 [Candidatus Kapabacteria bacterium]